MRRISTLTVLLLVLLFAMPGAVYSLDKPWNFSDSEKPDGDDHPWGGDEPVGDPVSPDDGKSGYTYLFTTGTPAVDYSIISLESIYVGFRSLFFEENKFEQRFYNEQKTRKSRFVTTKFSERR